MCDFSSDLNKFKTNLIENMQFFDKKWLDIYDNENSFSLEQWVSKYIFFIELGSNAANGY